MKSTFDIISFFTDFKIDNKTSGDKHCRPGWINIHCPFCKGSSRYHLGIHIESGACNCWRCGRHSLSELISTVAGSMRISVSMVKGKYQKRFKSTAVAEQTSLRKSSLELPKGLVEAIPRRAADYLIERGYDYQKLIDTWGLKFTGPLGLYKFRIIAPIYHERQLVSYQGRDYTKNASLRYKACSKENEVRDHKHCLYGSWLVNGNEVVVVEGIADAWRLGPGSVATFGTSYTIPQIKLLSMYKKIAIVFDGEETALLKAEMLAESILSVSPKIDVNVIEIEDGDPGEMDQNIADELMRDFTKSK